MTWTLVFALAAGGYACKAFGFFVLGRSRLPPVVDRCLALIPAALVAALVVKDTFSVGHTLQLDARAAGVGVAALAVWRRFPFIIVVVVGAGVTALVRQLA